MAFKPVNVGLAASEVATKALGDLGADDWRRLADLGNKHAAGRLSPEGFRNATLATIEPALLRAEHEVTQTIQTFGAVREPADTSGAERMRKYRERKRQEQTR